jgi:hypothetical protein
MSKAIIIPSDESQPLRWAEHNSDDWKSMTALVFGGDRDGGTFSASVVGQDVTFFYDDEGLFRPDAGDHVNARAMQLWADIEGLSVRDFAVPLIGDYVVVGPADDEGSSTDAPAWVMDHPFTWTTAAPPQGIS